MFETIALLLLTGLCVGFMGAFFGIGGGVIVVAILAMIFRLPVHTAVGTSLAIVVANSIAASGKYLSGGYANINLTVVLGFFSALGAVAGSNISLSLPAGVIFISLGAAQLITAGFMAKGDKLKEIFKTDASVQEGNILNGAYFERSTGQNVCYTPKRVPLLMGMAVLAGFLSGLVGVGGAIFVIPAMNLLSGIPIKAAIPTSGFMMGFTAVSGAMVFHMNSSVDPLVVASIVPTTFVGSIITVRFFQRAKSTKIYNAFTVFLVLLAILIICRGIASF
ncbi:MAG: sulfite exporter TauE/SafE family protein [Deferribacteraceae bacterium]|jgi:uncharacterized membrane protein YfcA|nr:sulfite exporter TauE/SafE family protein [Deferribacteraceae bacterium]